MGKRGPKPKDQRLDDLDGNPGKRPRKPDAVQATGDANAPDWLAPYAVKVWRMIIKSMPPAFYASVDTWMLAGYCQAAHQMRAASLHIKEHGITLTNKQGNIVRNPACQILSDGMTKVASLGSSLGLDPASRQAMGIYAGGLETPDEPETEFGDLIPINGGKS